MGELISLIDRRRELAAGAGRRPERHGPRATFSFDLALPATYLAAERVDRMFEAVRWQPAYAEAVRQGGLESATAGLVSSAEERAASIGVPLVWPEPFPSDVRPAMRVAALACEHGRGAMFVLAAGRLAFCGGFDLGDPEVLAEAAAASSIPLDLCMAAARDAGRDAAIESAGRRLLALGAEELPALRVGRQLFSGERRIPEAVAAAAAAQAGRLRRPAMA